MMLTVTSRCSAALYVVKVLRGAPPADLKKERGTDVAEAAASEVRPRTSHSVKTGTENIDGRLNTNSPVCVQLRFMGAVDVARVSSVFKEALSSFMSRRKSALTTQMFTDLFNRFPVSAAGRGGGWGVAVETVSPRTAFHFFFFFFSKSSQGFVREPFGCHGGVNNLWVSSAPAGRDSCAAAVLAAIFLVQKWTVIVQGQTK